MEIASGECADDVCIEIPVIVDVDDPYVSPVSDDTWRRSREDDGCEVTFEIAEEEWGDELCCYDDCTDVGSWFIEFLKKKLKQMNARPSLA